MPRKVFLCSLTHGGQGESTLAPPYTSGRVSISRGAGRQPGASIYTRKRLSLTLAPSSVPPQRYAMVRILDCHGIPTGADRHLCRRPHFHPPRSYRMMSSAGTLALAALLLVVPGRDLHSSTVVLNVSAFR